MTASVRSSVEPSGSCANATRYSLSCVGTNPGGTREKPAPPINGFVDAPTPHTRHRPEAVRERTSRELSAGEIVGVLNQQFFAQIQDSFVAIFPPPPVQGIGYGRRLQALRRGSRRRRFRGSLRSAAGAAWLKARRAAVAGRAVLQLPGQRAADRRPRRSRARRRRYGVSLTDVFDTLQVYLGSLYVNDFNRFGRTYQVNAQAESDFRLQPEQIRRLQTRNDQRRDGAARIAGEGERAATGPIR